MYMALIADFQPLSKVFIYPENKFDVIFSSLVA